MVIAEIISSGILENYCLGFCTQEENEMIESYEKKYPAIKNELEKIRNSLETYILRNEITPSPSVKFAVMLSVYELMARSNNIYAPLINKEIEPAILASWVSNLHIPETPANTDNLYIKDLPSADLVTNFIVYSKNGHPAEIHDDFIEYLYLIRGSCTMNFEGKLYSYQEGDLICIEPHINHFATVTSSLPMIALVQRQLCS